MNEALGRDALGFIARQTVQTQDFREAIYLYPDGKQGHWVRNTHSDTPYWVGDLTGGSTFEPGSIVFVASRSGKRGEKIIGRSPAGMASSSIATIEAPNSVAPAQTPPEEDLSSYDLVGFCWDGDRDRAVIARTKFTPAIDADPDTYSLDFCTVDREDIPHLDKSFGTSLASIELTFGEYTALRVYAMQIGDSSAFYIFFYLGEAGTIAGTAKMHLARISSAGDVTEHITYNFPDNATLGTIGTTFFGSNLYAVEYLDGPTEGTGGAPFENDQRITKRHPASLVVVAEYDVPDPSTYDGWTLAGSAVRTIFNSAGVLRAFFEYQDDATGDYKFFYQDFSSGMTTSGAAVAMSGNPFNSGDPAMGIANNVQVASSGVLRWVEGGNLYTAATTGSSRTLVLASYDNDGQAFYGIAQISATETLILGEGSTFSTSILTAAGQQLP